MFQFLEESASKSQFLCNVGSLGPFEDTPAWFKILYNKATKVHEERKKLRKVLEK